MEEKVTESEIKNQVKILACVMGLTRTQIEIEIDKNYEGEERKVAIQEMVNILSIAGNGNRVNRAYIRANRKKNGMSFSQAVKKLLR